MPYIPQNVINGVFYLYRDDADARAGRNPGGTGFIVRFDGTFMDLEIPGHHRSEEHTSELQSPA